jgi:hypothetical protein
VVVNEVTDGGLGTPEAQYPLGDISLGVVTPTGTGGDLGAEPAHLGAAWNTCHEKEPSCSACT